MTRLNWSWAEAIQASRRSERSAFAREKVSLAGLARFAGLAGLAGLADLAGQQNTRLPFTSLCGQPKQLVCQAVAAASRDSVEAPPLLSNACRLETFVLSCSRYVRL